MLIGSLWSLYLDKDCDLVEVNPLLITEDGDMVAADAKVILNDDAVFRHHEFERFVGRDLTKLEKEARLSNVNLVQLEGEVAVVANGAGLTMATLDLLELNGLHGGLFVDLGGTDDPGQVATAIELAVGRTSIPRPKALLVSVFGGITRCDTVAEGVIKAIGKVRPNDPNRREAQRGERGAGKGPARGGLDPLRERSGIGDSQAKAGDDQMNHELKLTRETPVIIQGITGHQGQDPFLRHETIWLQHRGGSIARKDWHIGRRDPGIGDRAGMRPGVRSGSVGHLCSSSPCQGSGLRGARGRDQDPGHGERARSPIGHGPHSPVCKVSGSHVHRSELAWDRHTGERSSLASCQIPYSWPGRWVWSQEAAP